jgi:hypothetical protein
MTSIFVIGVLALAAQQTDTTFAVRPNGSVAVENFGGSVTVTSWDRPQMRVVARHSSRTHVDISSAGPRVEIEVGTRTFGPGQAELELTVPRSFGVTAEGVNTTLSVADLQGDVSLETVNGAITVRGVRGRIEAESVQGLVTVEQAAGRIHASSVNQGVVIRNSSGEFEVEAVNGPVLLYGIDSRRVEAETVNGSVELNGRVYNDGNYTLATHNGRITMAIPEGSNARVSVYTFNGRVSSSFESGMSTTTVRSPGSSGRYNFTIGNGGATIELETFGGSIHLVRPGEIQERTLPQQRTPRGPNPVPTPPTPPRRDR